MDAEVKNSKINTLEANLAKLDDQIINGDTPELEEALNSYAETVADLIELLNCQNINFYTQTSPKSPNLGGVLSINNTDQPITLQYVRFPIDNHTVAGYVFANRISVNIDDVYQSIPLHPELKPTRIFEIDKKLSQNTKGILSCPIISEDTDTVIGVIEATNSKNSTSFSHKNQIHLEQFSKNIATSNINGFFSQLLSLFIDNGKSRRETKVIVKYQKNETNDQKSLKAMPAPLPTIDNLNDTPAKSEKENIEEADQKSKIEMPAPLPTVDNLNETISKLDVDQITENNQEPRVKMSAPLPTDEEFSESDKNLKPVDSTDKTIDSQENEADIKAELQESLKNLQSNQENFADADADATDESLFSESNEEEEKSEDSEEQDKDGEQKGNKVHEEIIAQLKSDKKPDPEEYQPEPDKTKYYDPYGYLVKKQLIGKNELHQCKLMSETDEKPIEPYLIIHHNIPLLEIGKSMSQFYKVAYSPYDPTLPKPEDILKATKVKIEFLQSSKFIPVSSDGKRIKIICTNPTALEQSGVLKQVFTGLTYRLCVTTEIEFQYTYQLFFGESDAGKMEELLEALSSQYQTEETEEYSSDDEVLGISDNEMVLLVNKIITDAYARNASDIHVEPYPGKAKTRIRYRIDGALIEVLSLPSAVKDAISTRIKVMANLDISDRRRPQDGKIAMKKFSSLNIELRVATLPTAGGLEDVVMRILASGEPLPMEKLGILPENEAKLIPIIEKPYGLLFVCGPTGSGKTTTLHSVLKHLNTPEAKIWTAEDPVEITQIGLRQVQVNRKAGLDFATVMRAFLRADPDIIMVGEMRDQETVSIGIEASLTGHLVLSTLHTNSAPEAIVRLLDMGMDPFNFADAILGILAQRLARRLCKCKEAYVASEDELNSMVEEFSLDLVKTSGWKDDPEAQKKNLHEDWIKRFGDEKQKITLYKAVGCGSCSHTGYKGRMGLHELMPGTDLVKRLIQQKARVEELLGACLEEGMLTLKMDGMLKVLDGITDMKQVRQVCVK